MANDNNPHAKLYPYYFTIIYANGVSIPIIAKTLAAVSYTHLLMKLPRPFKGLRSPPLEIAGKKKINVS